MYWLRKSGLVISITAIHSTFSRAKFCSYLHFVSYDIIR